MSVEAERALTRLMEVMAKLRDPVGGCPWDLEQTFATIAPYTLEEAYEVADAIERGDPHGIRDELGDLLFQVVFHARMGEEQGMFDFAAVATSIHDKLVRRHPHVFGDAVIMSPEEQTRSWEELKAQERAVAHSVDGAPASALDGIALSLPALSRAAKIGRRAARVGFDWPDATGVRAKVDEELREIEDALATSTATDAPEVVDEIGDVLFTIVNWSRHLNIDPESALRAANAKFERRFRRMEQLAAARGVALSSLSADAWEGLWREAKSLGG